MKVLPRRDVVLAAGAAVLAGCAQTPSDSSVQLTGIAPAPPVPRELRGAWVATVANIDWPRPVVADAETQRAQISAIVQRAAQLGLNALVLQVRPACDAVYPSALEPWSEYLSGANATQGRDPGYDPLALWITEAHLAGLQLHAWFNPFRAQHPSAKSPLAANHIARRQPSWALRYGDLLWLDPGLPAARAHSLAVMDDVVRRYDIDGVHIDDYFYPYPVKQGNNDAPFPDDASYAQYGKNQPRDVWRRANVNAFVQTLYAQTKAAKPWVTVSISPFGIPRPDLRPPGVSGFSAYDKLYADAELWLAQGWCDAVAPQLYWPMASAQQPFGPLLAAWAKANPLRRHLWPGLYTSSVGAPPRGWAADEITSQIAHVREQAAVASGHIHFSMAALMDNRGGLADKLASQGLALPPACPWLGMQRPVALLQWQRGQTQIRLQGDQLTRGWLLQRRRGAQWQSQVLWAHAATDVALQDEAGPLDGLQATALSATGLESEPVVWARNTASWAPWV
jgi:uncharacterized lipoprotein YddW (UPF0748 family)